MDGAELVETVRSERQTELSRLGSSKSLYADTDGEMEPDAVLSAMATATHYAAETLAAWAADGDSVFEDPAAREQDHYEAIDAERDGDDCGDPPAFVAAMDAESRERRLGALVGWTLVIERKASQSSGFFTGQAEPGTASIFRAFGDAYERSRETALETLETVCENDDEWQAALAGADSVVEAAYEDYFDTLESLGVKPKPVC